MTASSLPQYPVLPGLDIKTIWRPRTLNFNPQIHTSGREVIVGAASLPMHEFELIYNVIRAAPTYAGTPEFQTFMGFFVTLNGIKTPFQYKNPYDYQVTGQAVGNTDGVATKFLLVRTYGAGGFTFTEPIGFADLSQPFNVYIAGVLQSPSLYYVDYYSLPPVGGGAGQVWLTFYSPPAGSHPVTVDMSYLYYCRFADDSIDFEEVLWNVFQAKKLTIISKRGPAPS
jgi:uncharacterized protein (TIGR02217 family)